MQKIFLKWLFILVCSAFILTFATSYLIQTNQSQKVGLDLIKLKTADVKNQLNTTQHNLTSIKQMTYSIALLKAKFFAKMVYYNPKIITSQNELEKVKDFLDVDEVHVSNPKGILIASIPHKYEGFDMSKTDQTKAFMPAITNPDFELVQDPMMRGAKDGIFQYAGVARILTPGIIEIGFKPERLEEAKKLADIKNISDGFRIGKSGSIIIIKNDEIISSGIDQAKEFTNKQDEIIKRSKNFHKSFKIKLDGVKYVCLSDDWKDYTIVGLLPESEMYLSRNSVVKALITVNFILFAVIFILIFILLQRVVISGIYKVNNSLDKITNGDLDEKVDVKNSEEFEMLSEGINTTVDALKLAIDAAAKRLDEELELAKSIQHSALPNIFPPYPDHEEFEIYAAMDTAKEVGGDFYDFFFIDPEHFAFLVADVSGKGIPAALFMMTSKTIIKNLAKTGLSPEEIITKTNKQICKTNEQGFFVTLFLCVLELSTGKLVCVNAGHNPPLIKTSKGNFEYFKCKPNLVVGAMSGIDYTSCETQLNPDDTIFLYTDGITEALNKDKEFYGEKRLVDKLNTVKDISVENILAEVKSDVDTFSNGELQADDITMLALTYKGLKTMSKKSKKNATTILLPANTEKFPNLRAWLDKQCDNAGIPSALKNKLNIAVEEVFVNISSYAYPPKDGDVEITFKINDKNQVEMKFIDAGIQYNPLEKEDPDITLPVEERPIGGLGIFMVKKYMDEMNYIYENGKNILTIKMNIKDS